MPAASPAFAQANSPSRQVPNATQIAMMGQQQETANGHIAWQKQNPSLQDTAAPVAIATSPRSRSGRWGCGWASATATALPIRTRPAIGCDYFILTISLLVCHAMLSGVSQLPMLQQFTCKHAPKHQLLSPTGWPAPTPAQQHASASLGLGRSRFRFRFRCIPSPCGASSSATGARPGPRRPAGAAGGAAGRRWETRRTCPACGWAGACSGAYHRTAAAPEAPCGSAAARAGQETEG